MNPEAGRPRTLAAQRQAVGVQFGLLAGWFPCLKQGAFCALSPCDTGRRDERADLHQPSRGLFEGAVPYGPSDSRRAFATGIRRQGSVKDSTRVAQDVRRRMLHVAAEAPHLVRSG